VNAAAADGINFDGTVAFSNRGQGAIARPFFADGINGTPNGSLSKPIGVFSAFNDGLQLVLVLNQLRMILAAAAANPAVVPGVLSSPTPIPGITGCTAIPALGNGIQIFAGSVPLYRNGQLIGAIGISGDGIDQDDIIAASGSSGFEAPLNIRCDNLRPRGIRLPWQAFPSHPNIP
jgi:hypothetical protein